MRTSPIPLESGRSPSWSSTLQEALKLHWNQILKLKLMCPLDITWCDHAQKLVSCPQISMTRAHKPPRLRVHINHNIYYIICSLLSVLWYDASIVNNGSYKHGEMPSEICIKAQVRVSEAMHAELGVALRKEKQKKGVSLTGCTGGVTHWEWVGRFGGENWVTFHLHLELEGQRIGSAASVSCCEKRAWPRKDSQLRNHMCRCARWAPKIWWLRNGHDFCTTSITTPQLLSRQKYRSPRPRSYAGSLSPGACTQACIFCSFDIDA